MLKGAPAVCGLAKMPYRHLNDAMVQDEIV